MERVIIGWLLKKRLSPNNTSDAGKISLKVTSLMSDLDLQFKSRLALDMSTKVPLIQPLYLARKTLNLIS